MMSDFRERDGKYKLILPLRLIPNFVFVTKPTGSKEYEVKRELPIYFEKGLSGQIKMPEGCVYLCSKDGIEVAYDDKRMAVHFDCSDELKELLDEIQEREEMEEEDK